MSVRAEHSTDIYALGCIAFELLVGARPFAGPNREEYANQHKNHTPALTAGIPQLRALVLAMLTKPMGGRPKAAQILSRLDEIGAPKGPQGEGTKLLERVAAQISRAIAEAEARAVQVAARKAARTGFAEVGNRALRGYAEELFQRIASIAPVAQFNTSNQEARTDYFTKLGDGELRLIVGLPPFIEESVFERANIDVVAGGVIAIGSTNYSEARDSGTWHASQTFTYGTKSHTP
jgi:hypothetical protein